MGVLYVTMDGSMLTAGRGDDCDLIIGDPFVSRRHLSFTSVTFDVALVSVMGSNGAVIDDKKLNKGQKCYVRSGDAIKIGQNTLVFIGGRIPDSSGFVHGIAHLPEPDTSPVEIEAPPQRKIPEKPSVMLAAGPALTMAIPILLGAGRSIAILSSIFAAIWAASGVILRAKKTRSEEKRRKNTYLSYLEERKKTIRSRTGNALSMQKRAHPNVTAYLRDGADPFILWNSVIGEDGSLPVRIGTGKIANPIDIAIPKERFAGIDDSLKDLPAALREKYSNIPDAPVIRAIDPMSIYGFVAGSATDRQMLYAFILQIAVNYPPDKVRIILDVSHKLRRNLEWAVCLPHFNTKPEKPDDPEVVTVIFTDDAVKAGSYVDDNTRIVLIKPSAGDFPAGVCNVINDSDCGVKPDRIPEKICRSHAVQLARLWGTSFPEDIPSVVPFGKLVDGCIDEGSVERAYESCDITKRFAAPIGIAEGGRIVNLDLHEKAAGPHGVIAGTTGSGKSELLTTLILSFSMCYPADKLAFFLIDYKGGGMSNLFSRLPHVAGSISNLSKAESARAMIALTSENIRRQEIFAKCRVNNINDYTKLYDNSDSMEPLPHILVIVDEFAELRSCEPEFMDRLISVSQVGRSLGIHLILATQKPSGVVDDRIRANSRFRIALRLVDRSDSMDMLGVADAASIRECGRAYLQVGNNEVYELFQSGYAMGPRSKADKPKIYTDFLLDEEVVMEEGSGEPENDDSTWYSYICDIIERVHEKRGTKKPGPLWLRPLPEAVRDDKAYAVFDDPYERAHIKAVYDPKKSGNIWIMGRSGSGKSSLIKTLIARISSKAFVYIIDHGGGKLKGASEYSWCGGYIGDDDTDDIQRMTLFLCEELDRRRRSHRIGNPLILALDNLPDIVKASEAAYGHIQRIISLGKSVGIYVIASALTAPSPKEARCIDTGMWLGSVDPYGISDLLKVSARNIPVIPDIPGRGVATPGGRVLEFQAVIPPEYRADNPANAPPYPHVPDKPTLEDLLTAASPPEKKGRIPIGYEVKSGKVFYLPTENAQCILIGGKPFNGRHTLLFNISVAAAACGIRTVRADTYESLRSICSISTGSGLVIIESIGRILDEFYSERRDESEEEKLCHLFDNSPVTNGVKRCGWVIVGITENDVASRHFGRKIFESIKRRPYGIVFGNGLEEGRIFDFSYMTFAQIQMSQTRGYATIPKYDEKSFSGQIKIPCRIDVDNSQSL